MYVRRSYIWVHIQHTRTERVQCILMSGVLSDMTPCYEIVIPLFYAFFLQTHFHAISEHTHEHFSLFFYLLHIKICVYSNQSQKSKKKRQKQQNFYRVVFRSHPWHFDGSRKCLLTYFLFFSFIFSLYFSCFFFWWIACKSVVVGWRVHIMYICSRILISKSEIRAYFSNIFREFVSFLLRFIIIIFVVINLHCACSHLFRFPVFFSHIFAVFISISFYYHPFSLSFKSSQFIFRFIYRNNKFCVEFCLFACVYSSYHFEVNLIQCKQKQCKMLFKWN